MVDPVTVNRGFAQPTRGSDVGTWDVPLNGNSSLLDTITGGIASISVTTGDTALNSAQLACGTISVSGTLVTSASITFPAIQGWWSIENLTTGAFALIVRAGSATTSIGVPQGEITDIQVNGNIVKYRNLGRIGSYLDLSLSSIPPWIAQSTVPPYLLCDGSSFSSGAYPYLASILGGTTLPDLRGRARFYLNGGTNRITSAGSGINGDAILSAGGDQNLQGHSHTGSGTTGADSPDHTHTNIPGEASNFVRGTGVTGIGPGGTGGQSVYAWPATSGASTRHAHTFSFTTSTSGSGGSQNMPPSAIGGITLIRAG